MKPFKAEQMSEDQFGARKLDWLTAIRQSDAVQNWKRGEDYPDLELPEGYGFSHNVLSGRLVIMREDSIGKVHLDPRYETYHCM